MNDRQRQIVNLRRPHKAAIALSEECKKYMEKTKEDIRRRWYTSCFHHLKLNKKILCKILKNHGCKQLGYSIDWYCCMGMGQACWTESSDDGFMDDTSMRTILGHLRYSLRKMRPYLKNPDRVFWWRTEDGLRIYIFLRDTHFKYDFWIWALSKTDF